MPHCVVSYDKHSLACVRRWSVRHEGAPQRGKGMAELPAIVRSVVIAACTGEQVLPFWRSMGFQPAFELLREGQRYLIMHAGAELQARAPSDPHLTAIN